MYCLFLSGFNSKPLGKSGNPFLRLSTFAFWLAKSFSIPSRFVPDDRAISLGAV